MDVSNPKNKKVSRGSASPEQVKECHGEVIQYPCTKGR